MIESFLIAQQKQYEYVKQLDSKVNFLTTHNAMLEDQMVEQASPSSMPLGKIPSKPEPSLGSNVMP